MASRRLLGRFFQPTFSFSCDSNRCEADPRPKAAVGVRVVWGHLSAGGGLRIMSTRHALYICGSLIYAYSLSVVAAYLQR